MTVKSFTTQEYKILDQVATEVDQFYVEMRKGRPQAHLVIEVEPGQTWDDLEEDKYDIPVPEELVGFWMTRFADDQSSLSMSEFMLHCEWVKCVKKETVTYEWVES